MTTDKLTLTLINDCLYRIEQNIGHITEIKVSVEKDGVRRNFNFADLKELKARIDSTKPNIRIDNACSCYLVDEEFYQLVNFIVDARSKDGKPDRIFIDTAIDFSSGKASAFNATHIKDLNDLRTQLNKIYNWYKTATCVVYVEEIENYIQDPCYIEAIQNLSYKNLIKEYKKYVLKNGNIIR
jgi:hypothetical protein